MSGHDTASGAALLAGTIGEGPHRMTVGLRALDPAQWIDGGPQADAQIRERVRLLDTRADVSAALAGSEDGQREVLERLATHLPGRFPARYRRVAGGLEVRASGETVSTVPDADAGDEAAGKAGGALARAGRLVAEDLCLMREDAQQRYRLIAAVLCFPTRWRLADKLGRPMGPIHAPVPGYAERIGAAVDRVMRGLRAERPVWRQNWSLLDSPALYQPQRVPLAEPLTPADLGQRLWLRSERQTLTRLPRGGDVLFTIGIRQCRLEDLAREPGAAGRLLTQLRSLPPALREYKGLAASWPLIERWLEERQSQPAP